MTMAVMSGLCVFVATCDATEPGCQTIWDTDIQILYRKLIEGSLSREELQSFCRFWFMCHVILVITNIKMMYIITFYYMYIYIYGPRPT